MVFLINQIQISIIIQQIFRKTLKYQKTINFKRGRFLTKFFPLKILGLEEIIYYFLHPYKNWKDLNCKLLRVVPLNLQILQIFPKIIDS